eukprot:1141978-Amphidinium_carterae.1
MTSSFAASPTTAQTETAPKAWAQRRRRARWAGSGGTRSSMPTVDEEKACDAFLERIHVAEPDDFKRRGFDRRIICTRALRSESD